MNEMVKGKGFAKNDTKLVGFHDMLTAMADCDSVFSGQQAEPNRTYLKRIKMAKKDVIHHALTDPMTKRAIDYRNQLAADNIRIKPNPIWRRLEGWTQKDAREYTRSVKELWQMIVESPDNYIDIQGRKNGSGIARHHTRIFQNEGESMGAIYELGPKRKSPLSFAWGNVDPARVRNPKNKSLADLNIYEGKLRSMRGYDLGVYLHDLHPNAPAMRGNLTDKDAFRFVRFRTKDGRQQFVHSYVEATSDLARGMSDLASCLTLSNQRDKFRTTALEDVIAKAGLTFIIKSISNNVDDLFGLLSDNIGTDENGNQYKDKFTRYMNESKLWHSKMGTKHNEGNKILRLLHGEDVEGFHAEGAASFSQFDEQIDRLAAACQGLSVEEYRQQYDKINFSGARMGKLHVWQLIKALRRDCTFNCLRVIYRRSIEDFILLGHLQLPGYGEDRIGAWRFFMENKEELMQVEFHASPFDEIDAAKTAEKYLAEKALGVATWESYCNQVLGCDWEDRIAQIVEEVTYTFEALSGIGQVPDWTISEQVTLRLFGTSATEAREIMRASSQRNIPADQDKEDADEQQNNEDE